MEDPRWERIRALFAAAVELPAGRRADFLRESCGGDEALRSEVEALLASDSRENSLLDAGAEGAGFTDLLPPESPLDDTVVGKRIGPWRIVRPIGTGGMGAVYLAERADGQFEQTVALKLIKRGMDSDGDPGAASARSGRSWRGWSIPTSRGCWTAASPTTAARTS